MTEPITLFDATFHFAAFFAAFMAGRIVPNLVTDLRRRRTLLARPTRESKESDAKKEDEAPEELK